MNTIQLKNIQNLDAQIINDKTIEVLEIKNSTISLPESLGSLQHLKELHLINNTIETLPVELLELENTFVFCERNEPASVQKASVILFDLQRKTISKQQASLYFQLLNNETENIGSDQQGLLINALDYKIEEVQNSALKALETVLTTIDTIAEKSFVSVLGTPETFTVEDIRHRMKNVNVGIQNKITAKTTHVVLGRIPSLLDKNIDLNTFQLVSEKEFTKWLDSADEQMLGSKNEDNEDALANVSAMLLGDDNEHIDMALTMMKTHGVSFELLTDLYIFFNKTKDAKLKRKAKTLFKKKAPKELLTYFDENKSSRYGIMEGQEYNSGFYSYLEENPFLDRFKIAKTFSQSNYLDMAKDHDQLVEFVNNLIENDTLEINWNIDEEIEKALLEINKIKTVVFKYTNYSKSYDWITSMDIENLDIYSTSIKINDSFENFKNLKSICVPQYFEGEIDALTKVTSLEYIELQDEQFIKMPDSLRNLTNLKEVKVYNGYRWDNPIPKEQIEAKQALLPEGCIFEKSEYRRN